MQERLKVQDANRLIDIMADLADASGEPAQFFKSLLNDAELPRNWVQERGQWPANIRIAAQTLIKWAEAKGLNPNNEDFYTLGSILQALFPLVGPDRASVIAAVMYRYKLIRNDRLLNELIINYQIPSVSETIVTAKRYGPEIDWRGPTEELQLQGIFKREPDFLDVGFLIRAIEQARSVCRIETLDGAALGTGFLIKKNLLLTNYHVLQGETSLPESINANAKNILLRFGYFTSEAGRTTEGQTFYLDQDQPVVKYSSVEKLDYALLRVEDKIRKTREIQTAECEFNHLPRGGAGLTILQHPDGESMKLAISTDGVTSVLQPSGLVQYVTKTAGGSSGSPCFNQDWKVVALHHAERSTAFGSIREGILLNSIYQEIKSELG